jgi:signal peptidase I
MQPGLHGGNYLLVNLLAYRFGSPQRGDVVIINPPKTLDPTTQVQPLIKRIIAIPGDTVTISPTAVFVNGKKLEEPYLSKLPPDGVETVTGIVSNLKMEKDQYWVMGDNRRDSTDSRSFGVIMRSEIIGKAEAVIWPLNALQGIATYSSTYAQLTP